MNARHLLARLLTLVGLLAGNAWAAQPLGCLIEPERTAEIGSQVVGVIQSINVERGERVRKGQVLVVLHAQAERAAVGVAKAKQEAEADVKAAEASASFARLQFKRSEDLFAKNFISKQALDQARTEADVTQQKLSLAREQKRIADRELSYVQAQLAQRQIHSPFDGIVAERYLSPGERIEEKPVLRIAEVDPLRVQVVAPVALYGQIAVGASAAVMPELPNAKALTATVVQVDKIVDPASNTFRILLRLPNPDLSLPAGLRCKADFGGAASAAPASPAGAKQPAVPAAKPGPQTAIPEAKAGAALIAVPPPLSLAPSPRQSGAPEGRSTAMASNPPTAAASVTPTSPPARPPAATTPDAVSRARTTGEAPPDKGGDKPANTDAAEIARSLDRWAAAWSSKDAAAYIASYGKDFRTPDGRDRDAWENERRKRFAETGDIRVHYDNLRVSFTDSDRATAKLRQHYRSDSEKFFTSKTLELVKRNGKWLIVGEKKSD